ncbi:MAG: tRNA lysidine(34) synthetase TilS [Alphaproteobacteria bacterium]|nr:tRNA lysidine(34) synthetase TilS [Alphaproteobacteria bacterium]
MPGLALAAAEFAVLMTAFGPFEDRVRVAIGVSGGADSMALCLLLDRWVRERGGRVAALTVDHGLRPDSRLEAERVAQWLGQRGIEHHILPLPGPPITKAVQQAARAARYAVMMAWCRLHGVLHLAVAHNSEDQAETFLLRLGRGSGVTGLSAMAPIVSLDDARLIRPLLAVPRQRLEATATAFEQPWISDPSNHNSAFRRVRMRHTVLPLLGTEGLSVSCLTATAKRLGRSRQALDLAVAAVLARAAALDPAGFVRLGVVPLVQAAEEIGLRALAGVITCVGGALYPPRLERLERLYHLLVNGQLAGGMSGGGVTLGGCRIVPQGEDGVLVCRESARVAAALPLVSSLRQHWDGRFLIEAGPEMGFGRYVAALGVTGWRTISRKKGGRSLVRWVPAQVRPTLPAIFDEEGILAVPNVGYNRREESRWPTPCRVVFAPVRPMTTVLSSLVLS